MKKHSGIRPFDVPILLKIVVFGDKPWLMKDLAYATGVSSSEVSESLNRSVAAGLLDPSKKRVNRHALLEFIVHGIKYVFPQRPGSMVRGVPTSHSAQPLKKFIASKENYVWPDANGKIKGMAIEPLYNGVVKACLLDPSFHELIALIDAMRVGRVRERKKAAEILEKRLLDA